MHLARRQRAADLSKSSIPCADGWVLVVDMIKSVEHFPSKLEACCLLDWKVLKNGQIPTCQSRSAQDALAGVTIRARKRIAKGSRIKPAFNRTLARGEIA